MVKTGQDRGERGAWVSEAGAAASCFPRGSCRIFEGGSLGVFVLLEALASSQQRLSILCFPCYL